MVPQIPTGSHQETVAPSGDRVRTCGRATGLVFLNHGIHVTQLATDAHEAGDGSLLPVPAENVTREVERRQHVPERCSVVPASVNRRRGTYGEDWKGEPQGGARGVRGAGVGSNQKSRQC